MKIKVPMPQVDYPQRPVWHDPLRPTLHAFVGNRWEEVEWLAGPRLLALPCRMEEATDEVEIPEPPAGHHVVVNASGTHVSSDFYLGHGGWVEANWAHSPFIARRNGT